MIKFIITLSLILCPAIPLSAQTDLVTLDSCRAMALKHNRQLKIKRLNIKAADYQRQEATAAFLPAIDFSGGYSYNQKKLSVFDSDQLLPTKTFNPATGNYEFNLVKNPTTGEPIKSPDGQYIPETVALIPKESMTYDVHNVFFGAITISQPIYMGGKILAMNRLSKFSQKLATTLLDHETEEVICAVDAAYWQVISLSAKHKLALSYITLLDSLRINVNAMLNQGVATKADLLNIEVKLNQAQVDLARVENASTLALMALAKICGLDLNTTLLLPNELSTTSLLPQPNINDSLNHVLARRPDYHALELGVKMRQQQERIALSEMLPNVAMVGAYTFSNPNMFDGFSKRFDGAFSIGAMVTIPLWHWGGNYNKYRIAKTNVNIAKLSLDEARDNIALQVSQATHKAQEAQKTLIAATTLLDKANENLRIAMISFKEGVIPSSDVMEAQTAWLSAQSQLIDAKIEVRLCNLYLSKALGTLQYDTNS